LRPFARLLKWLLPARAAPTDPSQPIYLNEAARETPVIALAGAAREALRMADVLEAMLRNALDVDRGDRKLVSATKGLDNVLDRLNGAIKGYLTALDPDVLDEEDNCRLAGSVPNAARPRSKWRMASRCATRSAACRPASSH
jgi:phosphate:Na+ symporter